MSRIYVSSTYDDLVEFREHVRTVIKKKGHEDIAMEYYEPEDKRPLKRCLEDVASADVYLGIFAWRYGYIPDNEKESITVLEYREADCLGKYCIILLIDEKSNWPTYKIQFEYHSKIVEFRSEVSKAHIVGYFSTVENLALIVHEGIDKWEKNISGGRYALSRISFQIPPMPQFYTSRSDVKKVISFLLSDGPDSPKVIALHGIAGGGKTTVAIGICHMKEIEEYFTDGLIWMTLGQRPDCLSLLVSCIRALGDREYLPTTIASASGYLRSRLINSRVLIVIDDVWEEQLLENFLIHGETSKLLITTRRANILDYIAGVTLPLNSLSPDEAIALLTKRVVAGRSGKELSVTDRQWASRLADESGYLPLALNLMGALIGRGYSWEETLEALRLIFERHESRLRGAISPMAKLMASIQLSLNWLKKDSEELWKNFCWLGVLADEPKINRKVAGVLLGLGGMEASNFLNYLVDEALLQKDGSNYVIHDLIHETAKAQLYSHPPDGIGMKKGSAHKKLLENYSKAADGNWNNLPDDGYIYERLFYHLQEAGDSEQQYQLISRTGPDGGNLWYKSRDRLGQVAGFLDDLRLVWKNERQNNKLRLHRQFRLAIMISSLESLAQTFPTDLIVLLTEQEIWPPIKTINYVTRLTDFRLRSNALVKLAPVINRICERSLDAETKSAKDLMTIVLEQTAASLINVADNMVDVSILVRIAEFLQESWKKAIVNKCIDICKGDMMRFREAILQSSVEIRRQFIEEAFEAASIYIDKIAAGNFILEQLHHLSEPRKLYWLNVVKNLTELRINEIQKHASGRATDIDRNKEKKGSSDLFPSMSIPRLGSEEIFDEFFGLLSKLKRLKEEFPNPVIDDLIRIIPIDNNVQENSLRNFQKSADNEYEEAPHSDSSTATTPVRSLDFYLEKTHSTLMGSIDYIKALPEGRREAIIKVLNVFKVVHEERIGLFLVKLSGVISHQDCLGIVEDVVSQGKESIGTLCLKASLDPQAPSHAFYSTILERLNSIVASFDGEIVLMDAMSSIIATCPPSVVDRSLEIIQHIGDERAVVSTLFVLAPYLSGGVPEAMVLQWSDEKVYGKQIATLMRLVYEISISIKKSNLKEFVESVSQLSAEWWVVEALSMTVKRITTLQELMAIVEASTAILNWDLRARILGRTAFRLAVLGFIDEAFSALERISVVIEKWRTTADMALELANKGILHVALIFGRAIYESDEQGKVLAHVALLFAAKGDEDRARTIVGEIRATVWREYVERLLQNKDSGNGIGKMVQATVYPKNENDPEALSIDVESVQNVLKQWAPGYRFDPQISREFWIQKIEDNLTFLEMIAGHPRPLFLEIVKQMNSLILTSAGEEELEGVIQAINDVSQWWP